MPTITTLAMAFCASQAVRYGDSGWHWVILFVALGMSIIDIVFSIKRNYRKYGYMFIPVKTVKQKVGTCFIVAAFVSFVALFVIAYSKPTERRDNIYAIKQELSDLDLGTTSELIWYVPNVVIDTAVTGTDITSMAAELADEISRLSELKETDEEKYNKEAEAVIKKFEERKDELQTKIDDTYASSMILLAMGAIICIIHLIGIKLAKGYIFISPKDWAYIKSMYRKDKEI